MKPIITLVILLATIMCSNENANATIYIATSSGNFSNPSTWQDGVVPPYPLDTNSIYITNGVTVNLDTNILITAPTSVFDVKSGSSLTSTSKHHVSIFNGEFKGSGTITIDSMCLGPIAIKNKNGIINLNKIEFRGTIIDHYNLTINVKREVNFASGILYFYDGIIALSANAYIVYSGGTYGIGGGVLDLSSGYNIRYKNINYNFQSALPTTTLNTIDIAVGKDKVVTLQKDMYVPKHLLLTSGILNINSSRLTLGENAIISRLKNGGTIISLQTGEIVINSKQKNVGKLHMSSPIGRLEINNGGGLHLDTTLTITHELKITNGKLYLDGINLSIAKNTFLDAGTDSAYIVTSDRAKLELTIPPSKNRLYPIGTATHYAPASITNYDTVDYVDFGINVIDTVYAQGQSGIDLTVNEPIVKHTWQTSGTDTNLHYSFEGIWTINSEVNSFNPNKCFVSEYTNGSWDRQPANASIISGRLKSSFRFNINRYGMFTVMDEKTLSNIYSNFKNTTLLNIFPNPAKNNIKINYNGRDNTSAALLNMSGNTVKQFRLMNGNNNIYLADLASGNYILIVDGIYTGKQLVKE